MRQRRIVVWLGLAITLLLATATGLVMDDQPDTFRVSVALAVAAALLSLFAIPFFLIGLRRFKIELRKAYIVISVGIGIFGIAQVQLPFVNYYNIDLWIDSGAIAMPYLIGAIFIFWGMRLFTHALPTKTQVASWWLPLLVVATIILLVIFLPHHAVAVSKLVYNVALGLTIWNSVFITFAAILAHKVKQGIGISYVTSIKWLFIALIVLSFAGWHYLVVQLLFVVGDWYVDYSLAIVPFIAGGLMLVIAGYLFCSIDVQHDPSAPLPQHDTSPRELLTVLTPSQELEIVLYVTNLVSNPTDIDLVLSELSTITTRTQPGQAPSLEDQQRIYTIYARLEDYLMHRDPLRVFTQAELHDRIAKRFGLTSSVKTNLWRQGL